MTKTEKFNKTETLAITKEYLRQYPIYKATIKRHKEKIAEINEKLINISATDYSKDRVSGTPTEDTTLNLLKEKMVLEEKVRRISNICKDLESVVKALPTEKQQIIQYKYLESSKFSNTTWAYVARRVGYSKDHTEKLGREAVQEISLIFEI